MISVDEARQRILDAVRPAAPEVVALAEAWNRVTAAPVLARLTQPPADISAMDGYALRAADGVPRACLSVIGDAPAGHPFAGRVGAGEAVRLFTGSVVPDGADSVIIQEDVTRDGDRFSRSRAACGRARRTASAQSQPCQRRTSQAEITADGAGTY